MKFRMSGNKQFITLLRDLVGNGSRAQLEGLICDVICVSVLGLTADEDEDRLHYKAGELETLQVGQVLGTSCLMEVIFS